MPNNLTTIQKILNTWTSLKNKLVSLRDENQRLWAALEKERSGWDKWINSEKKLGKSMGQTQIIYEDDELIEKIERKVEELGFKDKGFVFGLIFSSKLISLSKGEGEVSSLTEVGFLNSVDMEEPTEQKIKEEAVIIRQIFKFIYEHYRDK